jgi:hypothetical protein
VSKNAVVSPKRIIPFARGFEIVLDTVEFPLGFGFAQGGFDMFADFTGYTSHNDARFQMA